MTVQNGMTVIDAAGPRGLRLGSMQEFVAFGRFAADSAFCPKDFRGRPADCALAAQYGAEIGLGPMQALQSIAVVNGRPTVWGDAALALVRSSLVCESVDEGVEGKGDDRVGFCTVARRGEKPQTRTFSVADAKRAGLWGKTGPWTQYPERMLQLRARGFALRDAFPDVLRGLITREEAADYQTAPEPVVVRPAFPNGGGLTVHHVNSFSPPSKTVDPADDFDAFQPEAVPADQRPVVEPAPAEAAKPRGGRSILARAKGVIEKAASLDDLDDCRNRLDVHAKNGTLTAAEIEDLKAMIHKRAEYVLAVEEQAANAEDAMQAGEVAAEAEGRE